MRVTTSALWTSSPRGGIDRPVLGGSRVHRRELRAGALAMVPFVVGYVPFGLLVGVAIARSTDWFAVSSDQPCDAATCSSSARGAPLR